MEKEVKKTIDPTKARFISMLAVSGLIMLLVFFLTDFVMDRALKNAEKQYFSTCESVLEGYSNAMYYYLENYHTSLSSIYDEEMFKTKDTARIQKWLENNKNFIHKDICATFYVTPDGKGYFSEGSVLDLSGSPYLKTDWKEDDTYYVSDIYKSTIADASVIIIEEPVFDNGELIGILCGSIKLDKFEVLPEKVSIGDNSDVFLIDRSGRFIYSPNKTMIGEIFVPANSDYKILSSDNISSMGSGFTETVDFYGNPIDLFYTKIDNCGWTLTVGFEKKELQKIYSQQNTTRITVIVISLISLFILLFLEMYITERFYRRQQVSVVYDSLTNLWTRQKFEMEAGRYLKHNPKSKFMITDCDIRAFKFINKNFGPETGDKVIFFYSTLLNEIVRNHHGMIGRGYADRFYCLFKVNDVRNAMSVFQKELSDLMVEVKKYEVPFFPKIGITFFRPGHDENVSIKDLIGQASFAKGTIKDNILDMYSIYNSREIYKASEENILELHMEKALEDNEFFVMYQPKISLSDDSVVGAEALVRWNSKDRGIITPDKFIHLFEKNGFIKKLDFYVYEKVFTFIQQQLKEGKKVVPISVNMSRNHNKPEKFMSRFMELFNKYKIPPELVQVEILERSVMDNDTLKDVTERLHQAGFSVAMDDFGSGESSLNMLTKVPVDVLKFDRDFLSSSTKANGDMDEKAAKFIAILINLSKHLEKQTVFEGVETKTQRDFLRSINCDQAQGYFYSKPLDEKSFEEFLQNH